MFECKKCNYSTTIKCNYKRHILSNKHKLKKTTPKIKKYICKFCKYKTIRKSNYKRHMLSCVEHTSIKKTVNNNVEDCLNKILTEQENIKKLIPNNKGDTIINNKLSINVYLNTTCKNAMSIQDFLNQVQYSLDDLKIEGYVDGISNMFAKKLANLDPKERPIHCSDKKRLQFYVKNTNTWEKDSDNENINMAIDNIQKKRIKLLCLWDKQNPGWENNEKLIMKRLQMANSVYGGEDVEERKKEKKQIKKNISEKIEINDNELIT